MKRRAFASLAFLLGSLGFGQEAPVIPSQTTPAQMMATNTLSDEEFRRAWETVARGYRNQPEPEQPTLHKEVKPAPKPVAPVMPSTSAKPPIDVKAPFMSENTARYVPGYHNNVPKAKSFQEIYADGKATGMTEDVRSLFNELPDKTFVVGGQHETNQSYFLRQHPAVVRGEDVAYIELHGAGYSDPTYVSKGNYHWGSPIVSANGAEAKKDTAHLYIQKPNDWPKRGLDLKNYQDASQEEKNYVHMARELTARNPRWILAQSCNQDLNSPTYGATPKVYDEMIRLPPGEKRLEFVVMDEPGMDGFAGNMNTPIEHKTGDKNWVVKGEKDNSPQLYRRIAQGWEDRGTFITNRIDNDGVDAKQLEQFEIRQMGADEYVNRMKAALGSVDKYTATTLLDVRPGLAGNLQHQLEHSSSASLSPAQNKSGAQASFMDWLHEKAAGAGEFGRTAFNKAMDLLEVKKDGVPVRISLSQAEVNDLEKKLESIKPGEAEKALVDKNYGQATPLQQLRANKYDYTNHGPGTGSNVIPFNQAVTQTIARGAVEATVDNAQTKTPTSTRSSLRHTMPAINQFSSATSKDKMINGREGI